MKSHCNVPIRTKMASSVSNLVNNLIAGECEKRRAAVTKIPNVVTHFTVDFTLLYRAALRSSLGKAELDNQIANFGTNLPTLARLKGVGKTPTRGRGRGQFFII